MDGQIWQQLGIALGLGLLVGLQREWAEQEGAGIRTFPLITVLGTICALLAETYGGWIMSGGVLALGAIMVVVNLGRNRSKDNYPGPTTEISALIMFAVGAMLVIGYTTAAIAVGGGVAVLLQWKQPLHGFAKRIGTDDIHAVFRLVLIALVVLPVLPNRTYDPYNVLNPFYIWLMVVLIVGISLVSYLASKFLGAKVGSILGGIFGGLVSSTATTVIYARRSRQVSNQSALAAMALMISSTVVFVRVTVEVFVVAPAVLPYVLPQFAVMTIFMALLSVAAYFFAREEKAQPPPVEDPSVLKAAVAFGALYVLVLFAVAVTGEHYGERSLYVVAAFSGLTDMDAITLSTAQMIVAERIPIDTGWRMMLVGALFNILFKGAVVAVLGHSKLLLRIILLFGLSLVGGILILWLWPHIG